jgi:hypothetical protein
MGTDDLIETAFCIAMEIIVLARPVGAVDGVAFVQVPPDHLLSDFHCLAPLSPALVLATRSPVEAPSAGIRFW